MKKIGIIGAMAEEVEKLKQSFELEEIVKILDYEFYLVKYEDKEIVIVVSGIGKVNAAICAQIMIMKFDVECIVNSGIAGAIDEKLNITDIIISKDLLQHDFDCTGFGYEAGIIPRMGEDSIFKGDEKLLEKIEKAAKENNIDYKIGRIATGDQFISTNEKKMWIKDTFNATCAEMESAAIAQTCFINKIPFLAIRCISDTADERAEMVYTEFEKIAIEKCYSITHTFIKEY